MTYVEWLPSLTEKQLRALACQCGVMGWRGAELPKLRKRLLHNEQAKSKYREIFGEETDLQDES